MSKLEKRVRSLEELVFQLVLQSKAESMAIREVLIEKNLVSSERLDELMRRHKTSYDSFKAITDMERRDNSHRLMDRQGLGDSRPEPGDRKSTGGADSPEDRDQESGIAETLDERD